jgi:hypothetical protein
MQSTSREIQTPIVIEELPEHLVRVMSCDGEDFRLRRWLVSFASGPAWYPVGEFVAQNAQTAIDRAVEVLGAASDYRAEEVPWDTAPLPTLKPRN